MDVNDGTCAFGLSSFVGKITMGGNLPFFFLLCFSWHKRGLTLHELGQRLIDKVGLVHAINLDGGSSSVLVQNDHGTIRIVNHPTCLDYVALKCERPVATVFCLGTARNEDKGHDDQAIPASSPNYVLYVVP